MSQMNTKDVIDLVNENAEMHRIAEYIISKCDGISLEDAKEYATYLKKNLNLTKSEILSGKADRTIFNWVRGKMMVKNSTFQNDEKTKGVQLKTKKEEITLANYKKRIMVFVAGTVVVIYGMVNLVSGVVTNIKDSYEAYQLESSISESIGMLASQVGNDAYEDKLNIVDQNTYIVPGSYNPDGSPVVAYRNEDIALDILKICSHNSELFNVCMQNTYFNMKDNRLGNIDEVLRRLKNYTEDNQELGHIYDQIKDCDIFIEYLVKEGFISPNDKDYPLLEKAIREYKSLREYKAPFTYLSEEYQEVIQKLIDEYDKNQSITYPLYEDRLKELVELDRKGGGRNGS